MPAKPVHSCVARYLQWHLRQGVELALERLGAERLALLQLHGWLADGIRNLDRLETLNARSGEGKIDEIGVRSDFSTVVAAGYERIELGPFGYLPTRATSWRTNSGSAT